MKYTTKKDRSKGAIATLTTAVHEPITHRLARGQGRELLLKRKVERKSLTEKLNKRVYLYGKVGGCWLRVYHRRGGGGTGEGLVQEKFCLLRNRKREEHLTLGRKCEYGPCRP